MTTKLFLRVTVAALIVLTASVALATNGMNLEGYGPVAHAMGGTSMAFDNGSAAMMNNPATLGFLGDGESYLNLAVGLLGPTINTSMTMGTQTMSADSDATSFWMPALGYIRRDGAYTWGFGVFGQGGMGTDYAADTFMAGTTGSNAFSQVSVGRALIPVAYQINEKLTLGATADFVWGGMDIKMGMPIGDGLAPSPGSFMDFMGTHVLGEATPSAGMDTAINNMVMGGMLGADDWALISFADDSDFTGAAKGTGFAGKLGLMYQVTPELTVGATYHLKTAMGDWEADEASMGFYEGTDTTGGVTPGTMISQMAGKMIVEDFQWPAIMGAGIAYQVNENILVAADYKLIAWADVMADFNMVFEVTDEATGLAGETVAIKMYQDWDDQSVIQLGAAYRAGEMFTLRGGAVIASNPVPDEFVNPLFPAIEETHFTGGLGINLNEMHGLDLSVAVAPEVEQTNSTTTMVTTHSQFNFQAMYTFHF
jgi:long-chain fatty acid transport protein